MASVPHDLISFVKGSSLEARTGQSSGSRTTTAADGNEIAREYFNIVSGPPSTSTVASVALSKRMEKGKVDVPPKKRSKTSASSSKRQPSISVHQMFKAASDGNIELVEQALEDQHHDVNTVDDFGWTLLMSAAFAGHAPIVRQLMRRWHADCSLLNKRRKSAGDLAYDAGHVDIANYIYRMRKANARWEQSYGSSSPSIVESATNREENGLEEDRELIERSGDLLEAAGMKCRACGIVARDPDHNRTTLHLFNTARKRPSQPSYFLQGSNKGYQMMLSGGWNDARGLGSHGQGRHYPLPTLLKRDRAGLGGDGDHQGTSGRKKYRITHFDAHDHAAVAGPSFSNKSSKTVTQMSKERQAARDKQDRDIAMSFRREFHC